MELTNYLVVIGEKYFYQRTLGRKMSNRAWCICEEDRPVIARRVMHDQKNHVICAIGFCGRFYFEVLGKGHSINSDYFISFLQDAHEKFVHERNSLGWKKMILIIDNARPHVSKKTTDFLTAKGVHVLRQPPYSPDYNLCDRWLFSHFEKIRKDTNFHSAEELNEFLQDAFIELDKATVYKQLQYLKNDLKAVIDAGGFYL